MTLNGSLLLVPNTLLSPSRLASLVLGESKSNNELRSIEWLELSQCYMHAHKCSSLDRTPTLVALLSRWATYEYALHSSGI
jgi:hypothetical protein